MGPKEWYTGCPQSNKMFFSWGVMYYLFRQKRDPGLLFDYKVVCVKTLTRLVPCMLWLHGFVCSFRGIVADMACM